MKKTGNLIFVLVIILHGFLSCVRGRIHTLAIKYNKKGVEHLTQGRLEQAKAAFRLALEYSPSYSEPYANLGLVYYRLKDYKKARIYFTRAIELNHNLAQAHNNLGVIYIKEHNYKKAIFCFKEALRVNPHYYEARWNLIRAYIYTGNLTEARKQAFILIEAYPDVARSYAILSRIDLALGQIEEAKDSIKKAMELDSTDYYVLKVKGILNMETGDYNNAYKFLRKAIEMVREDDTELLTYLGITAIIINRVEEAEKLIDKALQFEPENSLALTGKAYIELAKGHKEEAIFLLNKAVAIEPDNCKAWLLIARIYRESKENDKALTAYKKFISLATPSMKDELKEAYEFINRMAK